MTFERIWKLELINTPRVLAAHPINERIGIELSYDEGEFELRMQYKHVGPTLKDIIHSEVVTTTSNAQEALLMYNDLGAMLDSIINRRGA